MAVLSSSKIAGSGVSDTYVGGIAWDNPNNVNNSNNTYATVDLNINNTSSQALKATNFGFDIPTFGYSSIGGVIATFERKTSVSDTIRDTHVYLIKNGSVVGSNKSQAEYWSTTEGEISFGGPSDLWGATLTPSDVNSSNFGVLIACGYYNTYTAFETAYIDSITLTVYYTYYPYDNVKIGNTDLVDIYYGSTQVTKVYYGSTRVV